MKSIDPDALASVHGGINFSSILGGVAQVAPMFGPYGAAIGAVAGVGSQLLGQHEQAKAEKKARKQQMAMQQQQAMLAGSAPTPGAGVAATGPSGGGDVYDDGLVSVSVISG